MKVLQAYAPICGLHDAFAPVFSLIYKHLTERSGKGRIPGRQHLDPTELKRYLPMINLIDLVG